jgi:hypothetical protein
MEICLALNDPVREAVIATRFRRGEDPMLTGDNLAHTIKVLQGDMPAAASEVALFIDIFGRRFRPISFARAPQLSPGVLVGGRSASSSRRCAQ